MSELQSLMLSTVQKILDRSAPAVVSSGAHGAFPDALWGELSDAGLPMLLCPESVGGIGADLQDAVEVARLWSRSDVAVPLTETMLANWLLGVAGIEPGEHAIVQIAGAANAITAREQGVKDDRVSAPLPWARHADLLGIRYGEQGLQISRIVAGDRRIVMTGENLAGEPRDTVDLRCLNEASLAWHDLPPEIDEAAIKARTALLRAAQLVGAMERALELSLVYCAERQQFGRPLSGFQVIQHSLAVIATQVAATRSVVALAAVQSDPERLAFLSAVAKARASEAAGLVAASAHQVHGALGFTQEYGLGIATRRLWSWRSEDGSETWWHEWLGARTRQSEDLWGVIAA